MDSKYLYMYIFVIVQMSQLRPKKINLVFRATVLKTLGRVGCFVFLFLFRN